VAQKHVLVTISHAPHGSIWHTEGLRATVGLTSGIDEHTVDIVYLGDGVYSALQGVDLSDSTRYLSTIQKLGFAPHVERESLVERGLSEAEIGANLQVVPRSTVLDLIQKADVTIAF